MCKAHSCEKWAVIEHLFW